jgi:F420-dependent oxidoreductase-like protein
MRIAVGLEVEGPVQDTIERARDLVAHGLSSLWASQIFGPDTLTVLALVGRELPGVDLGTAVVPVQPRHPTMLAAQARTVQDAIGGRLSLGVGLSHQVVVEGLWGLAFDRPASYMGEYLAALAPLLRGETVSVAGERVRVTTTGPLGPPDVASPALLVAALGEKMLALAGSVADGTVLWMTGPKTIKGHIAPRLNEAAAGAGRAAPRVVCSAPIVVTSDPSRARERINKTLAIYATLPSYAAMFEREGAHEPADVSLVGSREQVLDQLRVYEAAGVSEFSGVLVGTRDEREATLEVLSAYH